MSQHGQHMVEERARVGGRPGRLRYWDMRGGWGGQMGVMSGAHGSLSSHGRVPTFPVASIRTIPRPLFKRSSAAGAVVGAGPGGGCGPWSQNGGSENGAQKQPDFLEEQLAALGPLSAVSELSATTALVSLKKITKVEGYARFEDSRKTKPATHEC